MTADGSKVALVTGAVGAIGLVLVERLVEKGWRVACVDHLDEADAQKRLEKWGDRTPYFKADVTKYEEQVQAFKGTWSKWSRLDAFFPLSAIVDKGSLYILGHKGSTEIPPKPDLACTEVDFIGTVYGVHLAIHFMRQNHPVGGIIGLTASGSALYCQPVWPEHAGAKAAVISYGRAMAQVLKAKENISLNIISPGIVVTETTRAAGLASFFGADRTTTAESVVDGYIYLLDHPAEFGNVWEVSGEKRVIVPPPPAANGAASEAIRTPWATLFQTVHGEELSLPNQIAW